MYVIKTSELKMKHAQLKTYIINMTLHTHAHKEAPTQHSSVEMLQRDALRK